MSDNINISLVELSLLKFFVYELQDPKDGSVFYVGKGTANRAEEHERESLKAEPGESKKTDKINEITARTDDAINKVRIVIIGRYSTEDKAYAIESTLIKWVYGFDDLTNKVRGHNHETIRPKSEFGFISGIDKNHSVKLSGECTDRQIEQIKENQIVQKLFGLSAYLGDHGITTSDPDVSKSQDPTLWIDLNRWLRVQIKLGLAGKNVVFNYRLSDFDKHSNFLKLMDALGIHVSVRDKPKSCFAAFTETRTKGSGGQGLKVRYDDFDVIIAIIKKCRSDISDINV